MEVDGEEKLRITTSGVSLDKSTSYLTQEIDDAVRRKYGEAGKMLLHHATKIHLPYARSVEACSLLSLK